MKVLVSVMGFLWLTSQVNAQVQIPSSRNPGEGSSAAGLDVQTGNKKKITKYNWWAARRAFSKRQNSGRDALRDFNYELEQEQIAYHRRMIYQINQSRKLEGRYRKRRYANPNYCYPPGKLGLKRKNFR